MDTLLDTPVQSNPIRGFVEAVIEALIQLDVLSMRSYLATDCIIFRGVSDIRLFSCV